MKTWKKIEDTRKRTNEIVSLKNRNEDRIRMVSALILSSLRKRLSFKYRLKRLTPFLLRTLERKRNARQDRDGALRVKLKLHDLEAACRREEESPESDLLVQDRRSQANEDAACLERAADPPQRVQDRD
jgi:hypothetical protein